MNPETRFVLVGADAGAGADGSGHPTHENISTLAHEIYREEGCPDGSDVDHWLAAETFLMRQSSGHCG